MNQSKELVFSAIAAAIVAVLVLVLTWLPLIGTVVYFLLPAVIVVITHRVHWKFSVLSLVVGFLLALILSGGQIAVIVALPTMLAGVLIAVGMKKKLPIEATVALGSLSGFVTMVMIKCSLLITGVDVTSYYHQLMNDVTENLNLGVNVDMMKQMVSRAISLLPATIYMIALLSSVVSVYLSISIMKRLGYPAIRQKPFRQMILPKGFLVASIVMMVILFITKESNQGLPSVVENFYLILQVIFLMGGIAAFYGFFEGRLSKGVRILVIIGLFLLRLSVLLFAFGIVDTLFDVRNVRTAEK